MRNMKDRMEFTFSVWTPVLIVFLWLYSRPALVILAWHRKSSFARVTCPHFSKENTVRFFSRKSQLAQSFLSFSKLTKYTVFNAKNYHSMMITVFLSSQLWLFLCAWVFASLRLPNGSKKLVWHLQLKIIITSLESWGNL